MSKLSTELKFFLVKGIKDESLEFCQEFCLYEILSSGKIILFSTYFIAHRRNKYTEVVAKISLAEKDAITSLVPLTMLDILFLENTYSSSTQNVDQGLRDLIVDGTHLEPRDRLGLMNRLKETFAVNSSMSQFENDQEIIKKINSIKTNSKNNQTYSPSIPPNNLWKGLKNKYEFETTDEEFEYLFARDQQIKEEQKKSQPKKRNYNQIQSELKSIILGQDQAIDDVIKKIMRKDFKLSCDKKSPASMFWAGPTGVGKTEKSLQLARLLNMPITRIDMSEFMKDHEVSKLIGAPPGYIGSDQPGLLAECDGQKSLIIFDEIEKAHPKIYNIFLQILDYGVLTTGKGKQIDLTNCIIVMTSNVGAQEMNERKISLAEESMESKKSTVYEAMNKTFPPEFINRLSSIQVFNSLSQTIVNEIIQNKLDKIIKAVKKQYEVDIQLSSSLMKELQSQSFSSLMGARPVDRAIEALILEPLSEHIMSNLKESNQVELIFDKSVKVFSV
jgi:ATP-dependent Clp protease ATP-binding subunit ClpA